MQGLPTITFVDIIDIILVAFLAYQIYKAVRGTNVLRIFWAVAPPPSWVSLYPSD